jgi:hypothetical protein
MKFLQRVSLLVGFGVALCVPSFAQDDIDELLEGGIGDAEKLVGAYVAPFMKTTSASLNQGWYNTAKAHKIAGFDLTITVNAMAIPATDLFYNVNDLKLDELELDPSSPGYSKGQAPTIFGSEDSPVFRLKDDPTDTPIEGPGGLDLKGNIGLNRIPVPMAHFGIGLPKGTDVKVRFIPTQNFDGTEIKLFGIGVMHDIKQWIPGIKLMPFDLSGFVGYTKMSVTYQIDDTAGNEDRQGAISMNATTIQALISKKFSVITFYGGLGYNIAKSNIALKGKYDFDDDGIEEANEANPVNLDYAASGPRLTGGMRLKLAIFTFHADYTLQKYNCLSAGFGLAIR